MKEQNNNSLLYELLQTPYLEVQQPAWLINLGGLL
jgi:hypothetical protein